MGLDMYLHGRKRSFAAKEIVDGFPVNHITLELGYWRKHPNLHGFIVQEFADGVDECQEIYLNEEMITKVIAAVKARQLPATTGFFFGQSSESDEEIAEDVKILEGALAWMKAEVTDEWRDVHYRASW